MENKVIKHIEINGTTYDVPSIEGFDFQKMGFSEQYENDTNALLLEIMTEGLEIFKVNENNANWSNLFQYKQCPLSIPYLPQAVTNLSNAFEDSSIVDLSNIDLSNVETVSRAFQSCKFIKKLPKELNLQNTSRSGGGSIFNSVKINNPLNFVFNIGDKNVNCDVQQMFRQAYFNAVCSIVIKGARPTTGFTTFFQQAKFNAPLDFFEYLDSSTLTNIAQPNAVSIKRIKFGNLENCTNFGMNPNANCEVFEFERWKQGDLFLINCSALSMSSIKYDIFHAMNSTDGAVNRILTLHATPLATWTNEVSNTTPTADDAELLGVTDWDIYKKEDGTLYTWGEIASLIKDITIA